MTRWHYIPATNRLRSETGHEYGMVTLRVLLAGHGYAQLPLNTDKDIEEAANLLEREYCIDEVFCTPVKDLREDRYAH